MKRASNLLNFCTGGSIKETLCARVQRHADNGSRFAIFLAFLIDYAFWCMLGEIDHIRRP